MKRDWGLLITLALALLALVRGLPPSNPAAAESTLPVADRGRVEKRGEAPERSARSDSSPAADACGQGEQLIEDYARLYWPAASQFERPRFRILIALVPDPEESSHTDYFDAVLDGIEEAAAAGSVDFWQQQRVTPVVRYVRDHHWLPWSSSDKRKRQTKCWEQKPGVIIYRPVTGVAQQPALVVLLVGETPTWGVRTKVLEAALATADGAGAGAGGEASSPSTSAVHWYRILGPTFSGSAPSLRAVLEQHVALAARGPGSGAADAEPAPEPAFAARVRIASGTATGEEVEATLEHGLSGASVLPSARSSLRVEYTSAVPNYGALLQAMTTFLAEAGGDSALLSESGTAYGEQPGGVQHSSPLLVRKFPPNLISLRKAYTAVDASEDGAPITRAPAEGAAHAEAQGELSDQTPITHDLALAEVLRELSQRGVRNLGISATDARDVIFIAERVGQQLPDVRLFTIGFDLRYLHPEHAKVLNGLLVAHAAPPGVPESSMVSQNPMTQRVSAAGRFLLQNRPIEALARVSLIGNGSIRQLAPDRNPAGAPQQAAMVAPRSFRITVVLALLVLLAGLLIVTGPGLLSLVARIARFDVLQELGRSSAFLRRRGALHSWIRPIDHADLAADDACATLGLVSVLVSALLMLLPGLSLQNRPVACVLAWAVPSYVWLVSSAYWLPRARGAVRGARGLGLLMAAVALAALSIGSAPLSEARVWLLSGGSALTGGLVAMAMVLVVAWCWRVRLRALDLLRLGAPPGSRFSGSTPPIAQVLGQEPSQHAPPAVLALETRLLQVLRSPWSAAPLLPALINLGMLASVAAVASLKPFLTFEPGVHHALLLGVAVACLAMTTNCFAHLLATSRALLRLLRAIATPSLLVAFARIPRDLAFRLESELVHARRGAAELAYPVQCLAQLAADDPEWTPAAQGCGDALQEQLRYEAGVHFAPQTDPAGLVDELLCVAGRLSRARERRRSAARDLADDFRACLVAVFLARYLQQLRSMVAPVVTGCVLAILMTSLYFVQPRHLIATTCFIWVTGIVLMVVITYLSLARDAVLSAIGGTVAGSVDLSWGLVARIGAVTVVPLASFVASQYPEFVFWITSMFGNITQFVQ